MTSMSFLQLVAVVVTEYDPAIRFFVEVLGFELVEDSPAVTNDGRVKRWVVVRPPGAETGLLLARADGEAQTAVVGRQHAGRVGFFLRVDDFDAQYERMRRAGVEFVGEPRHESYGRVVVFVDVAGNRWDLLGPAPAVSSGRSPRMNDAALHEAIVASFLQFERPPTIRELSARFECSAVETREGLRGLADRHGVVLQPHSDEVWVAHPFSAAPTTFVVRAGERRWWGNCAWCSLGVAHLAGGTATIETRIGALEEAVTIRIVDGELRDSDYVVHFPVPMSRAWENVIYTCSVMLLFRDDAQVGEWCATRGIVKGDVRPLEQVWRFATEWYGRHADADWTKWSTGEAAEIFARHGLSGPTWALDDDAGRF